MIESDTVDCDNFNLLQAYRPLSAHQVAHRDNPGSVSGCCG
jgi:hypothetical protein